MGKWQKHVACEECGSSDANTLYEDGSYWCYSCHTYTPKDKEGEDSNMPTSIAGSVRGQFEQTSFKYVTDPKTSAITDRGITLETCKKYGVKTVTDEDGSITHHQYPYYDKHNSLVAYKIREVETKGFRTSGNWPITGLFGQHLFNSSAKYITVCEGELDALAAHQMLGNYPVVSIRNGAG